MPRRTTAPRKETKSAGQLKLLWLIVLVPSIGEKRKPPRNAPTIPTTMLRRMPCCASVRMRRLASHPMSPPVMSQRRKFIERGGKEKREKGGELLIFFLLLCLLADTTGVTLVARRAEGLRFHATGWTGFHRGKGGKK